MKKSTLKKIIPIMCVVAVTLCSCSLTKKKEDVLKVKVAETVYGIEWGSSMEEVKSKMTKEGLEEKSVPESYVDEMCAYIDDDYNGIKGADANIMYLFNDEGKLTSATFYFKTSEGTDAKVLDKLKQAYDKAFDEILYKRKDLSDTDASNDFLIYWLGVDSIVSISGDDGESFMIVYYDKASQPKMVEELEG